MKRKTERCFFHQSPWVGGIWKQSFSCFGCGANGSRNRESGNESDACKSPRTYKKQQSPENRNSQGLR